MHLTRILPLIAIATTGIFGQQAPDATQRFDVVAIHPSKPALQSSAIRRTPRGGLQTENATVEKLILFAYGVRDYQLGGGPGWIKSEGFDITATVDPPEKPFSKATSRAEIESASANIRKRVATMLEERFGLVLREESKDLPVYVLKVSPKGIKMKDVTATPKSPMMKSPRSGELHASSYPMGFLADGLARYVDRPVLDETGLTGLYDFDLSWTPETGPGPAQQAEDRAPGASIFTALQEQLGLRLEAKKAPVKTLVIQKVERPTAN